MKEQPLTVEKAKSLMGKTVAHASKSGTKMSKKMKPKKTSKKATKKRKVVKRKRVDIFA